MLAMAFVTREYVGCAVWREWDLQQKEAVAGCSPTDWECGRGEILRS